ncbi:putative Leucine-rich repeat family protein [Hibiscus syriacus]|uniref:Leucine-rich repeat family protein n=1 Tax=Hibiscus syriacus TaxID=106335 RepID=A0A6A2ZJC5_HIBSY|nr:F-box protein At2g27310-like [Hibiscus syriacus]KAE8691065.1 putative Leucine-rich repeat family protein [Hibiscus syriacus]
MNTVTSTALRHGGDASVSALHPDVFQSHILSRLDGASLASLASVSSQLHALSNEEHLWRNICSSTWPSVNHPRVQQIISTFPSGHRSFFSDSFPFPVPRPLNPAVNNTSTLPTELIFAVDVYYQNEIIYSKVEEIDTSSSWFLCSPFRVDLLDPKDSASIPVKYSNGSEDETWLKHKEENLSLSWIVIDPTRKRAVNMSSRRAVSVQQHWLTGDVHMRFGTVVSGDERRGSAREWVECGVVVTCIGKEGGEMQVREVSMVMEDMEGKGLNGKDSLVILEGIIGEGRRRKERDGNEGKEKYEEFQERKRERKEEKQRKERVLDLVCITVGVAGFLTFWSAILFK